MIIVEKIVVIDIGFNLCWMVIYECVGGVLILYFNEKIMVGFGCDLFEIGCFLLVGKELVFKIFYWFWVIIMSLNIFDVCVVVIVVVREVVDGDEF